MNTKAPILLTMLLFAASTLCGQNAVIDSLLKEYNQSKQDTTRAELSLNIGVAIQDISLDSSFYYFNRALKTATTSIGTVDESMKNALLSLQGRALRHIGATYTSKGNNKQALSYLFKSLKIHEGLKERIRIAECYKSLGVAYCELGEYNKAIDYYTKSLNINQELKLSREVAKGYSNIGNVYTYQGNYTKAVEYYLKALKMYEQTNNKVGMSTCYTNMGGVCYYQKSYHKAIDYYTKSLEIDAKLGDKSGVSINYNNIGLANVDLHRYNEAIPFFLKSIAISKELGEKSGIMDGYNNIGLAYKEINNKEKAIFYLQNSLQIARELNDKNGVAASLINIADLFIQKAKESGGVDRTNHLLAALKQAREALMLSKEANLLQMENYASKSLMNTYKELGIKSKAFDYAEVFIATTDSLFAKAKTDALAEMEAKYQNETKQNEIEILEKNSIISREKAQKQTIIIITTLSGLGILVFLVTFILRRLQITRRQKKIIEEKNTLLYHKNKQISAQSEEIAAQRDNLEIMNTEVTLHRDQIAIQHNEITASINYASRIQKAMLSSEEIIARNFPEYFVMHQPCQIVSGDFYWFKQVRNLLYIVAADCTGHGVPGAFMSMLGQSLLNDTISIKDINAPHETLNELRKRLKKALHQTGEKGEQQDGMDLTLCIINLETKILQFAGAYNPLYLIRNNELTVFKGDRMPIGIYPKDHESFTMHEIQLQSNDSIYLFSDGYVAQINEINREKFKSARFRDTLLQMQNMPMPAQKVFLEETLNTWKGNKEQVDDILVIGVRISS